jgi:hypothetical protein
VIDFLTHFYRKGTQPFQSLSALPDAEAVRIMQALYVEGSIFWERFKDPAQYLGERRQTEDWLRKAFISKGGDPQEPYPIYTMLGHSTWGDKVVDSATLSVTSEIRIPLSIFSPCDLSFTYPDSMISYWFGAEQPAEYYLPEYHGQVFTLHEIRLIIKRNGMPEQGWSTNMPPKLAHYVEAQVWNRKPLLNYILHASTSL